MPLGPSGCILRASLVGDAHKYVLILSNARAVDQRSPNFLLKCSKHKPNSLHIPDYPAFVGFLGLGHYCFEACSAGTKHQLTGTNWGCGTTVGRATAFRCERASRIPSIAKEVISDQPP